MHLNMLPINLDPIYLLLRTFQTATDNCPFYLYYHQSTAILDHGHVLYGLFLLCSISTSVTLPDGPNLSSLFPNPASFSLILILSGPLI